MSVQQNDAGHSIFPVGLNLVDEDSSFVAGDSPHVIDVRGAISPTGISPSGANRNGNRGYIKIDGTGDILVEIAHDGNNYGTQFTLKNGEVFDLTGLEVAKIRLTWSADSAYRVHVW